jgi:hypothetical protein
MDEPQPMVKDDDVSAPVDFGDIPAGIMTRGGNNPMGQFNFAIE